MLRGVKGCQWMRSPHQQHVFVNHILLSRFAGGLKAKSVVFYERKTNKLIHKMMLMFTEAIYKED
jgi:hypothetical protein